MSEMVSLRAPVVGAQEDEGLRDLPQAMRTQGRQGLLQRRPRGARRHIRRPRQAVTALIGPSGSGKTTLLRSINRLHDLTKGAKVEGDDHAR